MIIEALIYMFLAELINHFGEDVKHEIKMIHLIF